jgi:predicted RNA-binding protein (TIGR00451 family)
MQGKNELRRLSLMLDYVFGGGVSKVLPKEGFRLVYSRRSGRPKLVFHDDRIFATVKPNGSMALSVYGATLLSKSPRFRENCVTVAEEAKGFVRGGKSVFCKFVTNAGANVLPGSEVAVVDGDGKILGLGTAVLNGKFIKQFKSGVAVKVRVGSPR